MREYREGCWIRSLKGSLCSFVMRCWDKSCIHNVSPFWSPAGPAPCWPETVITHSVLATWLMVRHRSRLVWSVVSLCCKGSDSPATFWSAPLSLLLWSCNLLPLPCMVASPLNVCAFILVYMSSHSQLCLWTCCVEVLSEIRPSFWQKCRGWRE